MRSQHNADGSVTDRPAGGASASFGVQSVGSERFLPTGRPDRHLSGLMSFVCDSPEEGLEEFTKAIDEPLRTAIASKHPEIFMDKFQREYVVFAKRDWHEGLRNRAFVGTMDAVLITEVQASMLYEIQFGDATQIEVGDMIVACKHMVDRVKGNVVSCTISKVTGLSPFELFRFKPMEGKVDILSTSDPQLER